MSSLSSILIFFEIGTLFKSPKERQQRVKEKIFATLERSESGV